MMASQTQVRVDLRSISLSPSAQLAELPDGSFFVALDEPPPVRTVLSVREEDGEARAFEVSHVLEIGEAGPTGARGCQGRFVEAERLEQQHGVGSEHLTPGEPHSSPDAAESDDALSAETKSAPPEVEAPYDATAAPEAAQPSPAEPAAEAIETPSAADSAAETAQEPGEEPPADAGAGTTPTATAQDEPADDETSDPTRPAVTSSGGKRRKGRKRK
jgi:hypothetical protein